jgi:hypothetical protein
LPLFFLPLFLLPDVDGAGNEDADTPLITKPQVGVSLTTSTPGEGDR